MNVCKTGLQEASEIQNEVISAVKKHAQALQTAMDDKTDVSMLVLLLMNNLFLTGTVQAGNVHFTSVETSIFLMTGSATILACFHLT